MELDGINDIISSLTPEEAENLKATAQSLISNQDMPVGLGGDSDMKLIMRAKEIMNKMNIAYKKLEELLRLSPISTTAEDSAQMM